MTPPHLAQPLVIPEPVPSVAPTVHHWPVPKVDVHAAPVPVPAKRCAAPVLPNRALPQPQLKRQKRDPILDLAPVPVVPAELGECVKRDAALLKRLG